MTKKRDILDDNLSILSKLLPGDVIHDEAPRIESSQRIVELIDSANAKRARKMEKARLEAAKTRGVE